MIALNDLRSDCVLFFPVLAIPTADRPLWRDRLCLFWNAVTTEAEAARSARGASSSIFVIGLIFVLRTRLSWSRSPAPVHERLHLLQRQEAVLVGVHCLEDLS